MKTNVAKTACSERLVRMNESVFMVVVFCLACSRLCLGQATYDALTLSPEHMVGYATALNPGWTFVPTADLRVVAVGYPTFQWDTSLNIHFWAGTNGVMATYQVVTGSNTTDIAFQPMNGLILKAGSPYGISAQFESEGGLPFNAYSLNGWYGFPAFNTSPYISKFANFLITSNGLWSANPIPPSDNSDYLYLGPTFKFQLLSELSIGQSGTNLTLSWPTQDVVYAVQQNLALRNTNWITLTNVPQVVGAQNQITVPEPQAMMFYRLVSR